MPTYTVTVSKEQDEALKVVASKDSKTVDTLVQEQLSYYLDSVIGQYVTAPIALTLQQQGDLNALLATTKAGFIAEVNASKEEPPA